MRVLAGVLALACADIVGGLAPSHGSSSRASLRRAASSVDLRVGADAALADRVLSPGEAMRELYDGFNAHDLQRTAAVLDDDCVYEDLLLGPATMCRGRSAFEAALAWHPAFLGATLANALPPSLSRRLPDLTLVVDSVSEDVARGTVGVEWHVELGGTACPLSRGLSHANVDTASGKITRVVDIAEAPWRVVGLLLAPLVAALSATAGVAQTAVTEVSRPQPEGLADGPPRLR